MDKGEDEVVVGNVDLVRVGGESCDVRGDVHTILNFEIAGRCAARDLIVEGPVGTACESLGFKVHDFLVEQNAREYFFKNRERVGDSASLLCVFCCIY